MTWRTTFVATLTVAALGGILGWLSAAEATVIAAIPLDELAADADGVIEAQVVRVGQHVAVEAEGIRPYTTAELHVHRWLRGRGPRTLELTEAGGRLPDGTELRVMGTPIYRPGERVIVFLRNRSGRWHTHQMAQGKLEVLPGVGGLDATLRRDLRGVAVLRGADIGEGELEELTMAELLAAIRPSAGPASTGTTAAP